MSDGNAAASPGDVVTYTLTYSNDGNQGATGVVITETLPDNTTFNAAASTPGWVHQGGGVYTFDVGNLPAGVSGSVLFGVTVDASVASGVDELVNNASAADDAANGPDQTAGDNTATDRNSLEATPDYRISITDGVSTVQPGDSLTYTIAIENVGNQEGTDVVVGNTFPADVLTGVAASHGGIVDDVNGTITWNLGAAAAGETIVLQVTAVVDPDVDPNVTSFSHVTMVADDGANGADPTPADQTSVDVDRLPVLSATADVDDVASTFAFDSFHNEADEGFGLLPQRPVLVTRLAPPLVNPIISGVTAPGATLNAKVYDAHGNLIGERQVVADSSGNWLMTFSNAIIDEAPHRMDIAQTPAIYSRTNDRWFNFREHFQPAIHTAIYFTDNLTVESVFRNRAEEVLEEMQTANANPMGVHWFANTYEIDPS